MSEQLKNVLWMTEELDFKMSESSANEASSALQDFLESAGGTGLTHLPYPASTNCLWPTK